MSFFKKLRHIIHPVSGLIDKQKATASKLKERDAQVAALQGQNDPATQLATEQANYNKIDADSMTQATDDAKRAGTYSADPAFQESLKGEAGARARGLKTAGQGRINALREKLGLTQSPAGSV